MKSSYLTAKQFRLGIVSALCVFLVLVGSYVLFQQNPANSIDNHSIPTGISIVLDQERQSLAAGAWQKIPVNIPHKGLLEIDLQVVSGNPIDVIFIAEDQLELLSDQGWSSAKGNPGFTADKSETYQRLLEVAEGNYYLVYRDALLGILSKAKTDVNITIVLSPD